MSDVPSSSGRLPPRIEVAPYDLADALRLERELGLSHPLAQVLVRRGLGDPAAARAWLAADERHPPGAFAGIGAAVELLLRHVAARTRITVHGDYDVDGVCSTAVLVGALRRLGADVDWFLPSRTEDGYGLSTATIGRLAARGTRLLVAVDCGITAVEPVATARAAGLDVVVVDHHALRADGALPEAPIVHPLLGGYPCAELCATGVAHKLVEALAAAAGRDPREADEDLDLVALATVADVVPLRGENRRLVREGLRALAATRRPGLRALMRVAQVDPSGLDAGAIGFRLAPRLNAAGRLQRADASLELLLCEDPERADAIAQELDAANAERRHVETRILFAAEAQVAEAGPRPAYVLAGDDWHPGVIGIVAARIAERHHRPAVLVAMDGETGTGSGRSIPGYDLLAGLTAGGTLLERYGGHRAAAGLEVRRERLGAFAAAFAAHAEAALGPDELVPVERVDAVVPGAALGLGLAEELGRLAPFGAGNPSPTLLVPAVSVVDPQPVGEGRHTRLTLQAGGARCRAMAFGTRGRSPAEPGVPVDAVARLEVNRYAGAVEPRLVLREARPAAGAPIVVLGEPEDFLAAALGPPELEAPGARTLRPDRQEVDRRGLGVAGTVAGVVAAAGGGPPGPSVLVVCADVPRRLEALRERLGGFALCSHAALVREPGLSSAVADVVAVDPPVGAAQAEAVRRGPVGGRLHLAWGPAELAFAARVHEREHALRAPLAELYRALRADGRCAGAELAAHLRGPGTHGRTAAQAGALVRVLEELGLVDVDRAASATVVRPDPQRTALEDSPTYRLAVRRLDEGRRWLSTAAQAAA